MAGNYDRYSEIVGPLFRAGPRASARTMEQLEAADQIRYDQLAQQSQDRDFLEAFGLGGLLKLESADQDIQRGAQQLLHKAEVKAASEIESISSVFLALQNADWEEKEVLHDRDENNNDTPVTIHPFQASIDGQSYDLRIAKNQVNSKVLGRVVQYKPGSDPKEDKELFTFNYDPNNLEETPSFSTIKPEELNNPALRNAAITFVKLADNLSKVAI